MRNSSPFYAKPIRAADCGNAINARIQGALYSPGASEKFSVHSMSPQSRYLNIARANLSHKSPRNGSRKTVARTGISSFSSTFDRDVYKWSIACGDPKKRLLDQFRAEKERRDLARMSANDERCVSAREYGFSLAHPTNERDASLAKRESNLPSSSGINTSSLCCGSPRKFCPQVTSHLFLYVIKREADSI